MKNKKNPLLDKRISKKLDTFLTVVMAVTLIISLVLEIYERKTRGGEQL